MGNSIYCSLIYFWVPSSCFCIVISLSEGEIIPFSGVCQSGEAAISTPEAAWWLHALTDEQLMCNRRRPAATSSRRASFSALASLTPSCILHRAQQHHADVCAVSNCRVRQLQFSGIFCRAGLCRRSVITVMINSP